MIYPVWYDGHFLPVEANSQREAKAKLENYLKEIGITANFVFIFPSSDSYIEWVTTHNIKVIK